MCKYFNGTLVRAAKRLLILAGRSGSLSLIAKGSNACDFDEFMKGLRWLASQELPCKGCRFEGGWSWWPDCPVRDCVIEKGIEFCHQCRDFPCKKLKEGPLLANKWAIVETNNQIKSIGLERHIEKLKEKYRRLEATIPNA